MGELKQKKNRLLDIFYRLVRGESISVRALAEEHGVSTKSIHRDISEIRNFLSSARELAGNTELRYLPGSKTYCLEFDSFLLSKELTAMVKVLIGCRAFSKMELLGLVSKLKAFTTHHDRRLLESIIAKEMYHYNEVRHDCRSVTDMVWLLTRCINEKKTITVTYYKTDRKQVERRLMPVALMFSEFYFYLVAYYCDAEKWIPLYYRVDRIVGVVEHREHFTLDKEYDFDEGELRNRIQFMHSGEYRRIKFSYRGPLVQAVLDRLPTAKVVDVEGDRKIIEAETYGTGINMFLLSQGDMVQVLEPAELVEEMAEEINRMAGLYCHAGKEK